MESDNTVALEAAQVSAKANSNLKLESAGTASLGGSTVSVG